MRPSGELTVKNASDFGLNTASADNSSALAEAFSYCSSNPDTELVINAGTYYFESDITAALNGTDNVLINGGGAEFIFSSRPANGYFLIQNSTRVEIKNLKTDWNWNKDALASVAKVTNIDTINKTIEFTFPNVTDISADINWTNLNQCDPVLYTAGVEGGKEFWPADLNFTKIEKLSTNVLKVTYTSDTLSAISMNDTFIVRHCTYGSDLITVSNSNNITINSITNYSNPGMCFKIVNETMLYQVINCSITKKNSLRPITSTADALHVSNTKGYGIISNNDFGYTGDDCININDTTSTVVTRILNYFTVTNKMSCSVGDTITFKKPDFSPVGSGTDTAKIISITKAGDYFILRFDKTLSAEISENYILVNNKFNSANVIIKGNYFHENRARGILIQAGNIQIENNRFYKIQGSALIISLDIYTSWSEGIGVNNLLFAGNIVEKCNIANYNNTALIASGASNNGVFSTYSVFANLTFQNNIFIDFPTEAFSIRASKNVLITGNTFKNPQSFQENKNTRATLTFADAYNVTVTNNTWYASDYVTNPAKITIDRPAELTAGNNQIIY